MPLEVRASDLSNTSVRLTWRAPDRPKGDLLGYRLYFMRNNNFTDVVTVRETGQRLQYILHDLSKLEILYIKRY